MPTVLRTTPPGQVDPREQASVSIYRYERAMERRETARIAVDGGEVHLDIYAAPSPMSDTGERGDSGRGTVVFVGGLSAHALMYADFLDRLCMHNWNVVALDVRGHGRSSGRRGDFTVKSVLEDMRCTIEYATDRFGGPVGFMGSSLGGFFSLCASNALDGIACAVSHWIFLPDSPVTKRDARMKPVALTLNKLLPGMRLSTKKLTDWNLVCNDPELVQRCLDDPLMTWGYTARALAAGMTYDPEPPLTQLQVPTLIVLGERDQMTPLAYTRGIVDRLEGDKEFVVIPGAGHMGGLVEHQEEMLAAVDGFLAKHLAPVAARS